MRHSLCCIAAGLGVASAAPAAAEVAASSETGFVSHNQAVVPVSPEAAWDGMLRPADWWNAEHTYSGNPANLELRATIGGCLCEAIPGSGNGPGGAIEHMRVVYVAPRSTLRMTGGLGPLQSEAVTAVLTMTLEPAGASTRISWDYVVGGYMRMPMTEMAPLVDRVVGEQLARLAAKLANP